MQYSSYLWPNRQNFRILKEIGAEEHDGDVRFSPEVEIRPFRACANRNASGHNYWNSSFIIDVAMGQIPRSTERISSLRCGPAS